MRHSVDQYHGDMPSNLLERHDLISPHVWNGEVLIVLIAESE